MKCLKLDIDEKKNLDRKLDRIAEIALHLGLDVQSVEVAETRKGFHVKIIIRNDIKEYNIVTIQSLMGSDWLRETYNFIRVAKREKKWNVLFSQKYELACGRIRHIHTEKPRPDLSKKLKRYMRI